MNLDMKEKHLTQLALATTTVYLVITVLLFPSPVIAQDRFVCKIGATMDEVLDVSSQFPQIQREASVELVTLRCPEFRAEYQFDAGYLSQMILLREYPDAKLAHNSLEIHLLFLERGGATVQLMHADKKERVYCALADDGAYEVSLRSLDHGRRQLQIRSWRRSSQNDLREHYAAFGQEGLGEND